MQPVATAGGKRKADDEAEDGGESRETLPAARKPRKKAKRGKDKADDKKQADEQKDEPAPEPPKEPGTEWVEDGVKYKMGDDGQVLREAVLKEKRTVVAVSLVFTANMRCY